MIKFGGKITTLSKIFVYKNDKMFIKNDTIYKMENGECRMENGELSIINCQLSILLGALFLRHSRVTHWAFRDRRAGV